MNHATQHSKVRSPEAAALCDVTSATISEWVRTGKLPAVRLNGRYLIDRSDLDKLLDQKRQEAK